MPPTPVDFDVGQWAWAGVTATPAARPHFNRGLQWMYGYNHHQACEDFRTAAALDGECAMARWCIAYSMGPNYNTPWGFLTDAVLHEAVDWLDASAAVAATPLETALCAALRKRYPQRTLGDTHQWNVDYADAMVALAWRYPREIDVLALAAEAVMGITPWKLWDVKTGRPAPAPARTLDALALLQRAQDVIESDGLVQHVGVCHFFIHVLEMSPHPERALKYYDLLVSGLCPALPHLLHMGTHIAVLCGDYRGVVTHNKAAVVANKAYFAFTGTTRMFYTLYMLHDYHFWMYGAMFEARYADALEAADGIWDVLDDATLRWDGLVPGGLAVFAEAYRAQRHHVHVRFGKWDAILAEPFPTDAHLHCVATATLHYARALAFALGRRDVAAAERELVLFEKTYAKVPAGMGRTLHNNTARDLLDVSREVAKGEVAFAAGRKEEAVAHLQAAVRLDDGLPYDEPWGVMTPTRHALGAVLLEVGRPEEALRVYRDDLGATRALARCHVHPENVWAMLGVADCLRTLGRQVPHDFQMALDTKLARADADVKASCFCRLSVCCRKASL